MYLHQKKNWSNFEWNEHQLLSLLENVRHLQSRLLGQMESLGFHQQDEAVLGNL